MAMTYLLPRRREILSTGAAAIAAAPLFVPQSAFGANDRINYAVIATGGRGRYVSRVFQKLGAQCVALCDVYEPNIQQAKKDAPDAKVYGDYRELLAEEKGLDAVLIASPDHHHCPMLLASVAAKKDVYAEKPLSKTLEESVKMIRAVRESKQVVQIGMQRRSAPAIHRAKKLVDDGVLGRVTMVKAHGTGTCPSRSTIRHCRETWIGRVFSVTLTSGRWSRCGSVTGATSTTTQAAT